MELDTGEIDAADVDWQATAEEMQREIDRLHAELAEFRVPAGEVRVQCGAGMEVTSAATWASGTQQFTCKPVAKGGA